MILAFVLLPNFLGYQYNYTFTHVKLLSVCSYTDNYLYIYIYETVINPLPIPVRSAGSQKLDRWDQASARAWPARLIIQRKVPGASRAPDGQVCELDRLTNHFNYIFVLLLGTYSSLNAKNIFCCVNNT